MESWEPPGGIPPRAGGAGAASRWDEMMEARTPPLEILGDLHPDLTGPAWSGELGDPFQPQPLPGCVTSGDNWEFSPRFLLAARSRLPIPPGKGSNLGWKEAAEPGVNK